MSNKAHTATLNRICHRYGGVHDPDAPFDIVLDGLVIEVETSASLPEAIERLKHESVPVYVAVTNKEGIKFAIEQVQGTRIGVMDPQGNVLLLSGDHVFETEAT